MLKIQVRPKSKGRISKCKSLLVPFVSIGIDFQSKSRATIYFISHSAIA